MQGLPVLPHRARRDFRGRRSHEDDEVLAFRTSAPAPVHGWSMIPAHIDLAGPCHRAKNGPPALGRMLARFWPTRLPSIKGSTDGFRSIINTGPSAGGVSCYYHAHRRRADPVGPMLKR